MARRPPIDYGSSESSTAALIARYKFQRGLAFRAAVAGSSGVIMPPPLVLSGETATAETGILSANVTPEALSGADSGPQADTPTVITPEVFVGLSLIVKGDRTDEGVIVEAVAPVWWRFLDLLARDPNAFSRLKPRQFEELIAGVYRERGFRVTLTPASGDRGVDVVAERDDFGSIRLLDQVKLYKPGHVVTAEEVRAFSHALNRDRKASKGVLTTTSSFAPRVYTEFAEWMPSRIEFRDRNDLMKWLEELPKKLV